MTEELRDQELPTMFPNHHQQLPPQSAVNHHLATTISEEADSKKESNITSTTGNEGASTEVMTRRPRGRPPGSRNKRKSPVLVTPKPDTSAMPPYVLEVSSGSDIVTAVTRFCNHRNTGLCVLSGSGTVSNVSVRQPTTSTAATVFGRFDLLSISATILPSSSLMPTPFTNNDFVGKFVVSLAGQKGQTFGGAVVGPLIAVGTVYIVAASFNNPLYHRLPMEEDEHMRNSGGASDSAERDQSQGSGGGDSTRHHVPPSTAAESLSMYSCHLPSADVIWTPIPRQAPPHSSFYSRN